MFKATPITPDFFLSLPTQMDSRMQPQVHIEEVCQLNWKRVVMNNRNVCRKTVCFLCRVMRNCHFVVSHLNLMPIRTVKVIIIFDKCHSHHPLQQYHDPHSSSNPPSW